MPKDVAVILVNWNTPQYTGDCIRSLYQYCNHERFDVIVVDNGSKDGSVAILQEQFPEVKFICNYENLGFAEGNNKGLAYSINNGYVYSLVINTDTLVDEDIIEALVNHLQVNINVAGVQPAIYWMHNRGSLWNGPCYFNSILGKTYSVKTDDKSREAKTVEWITGCCMLVRNEALKKAGLFNKQFFLYYEDVELSFRLRDHGYLLHYLPSSKMYHEAGMSGKAKVKQKEGFLNPVIHYYVTRNHIWFLRRYGKKLFYPIYWLYNSVYYSMVLTYLKLRGRNQKVSSVLKGIKDGLFTAENVIWP